MNSTVPDHMTAQAIPASHYIDAALKAGMTTDQINAVLMQVADRTIITEFRVTDGKGRVEYTNQTEIQFSFPTDPDPIDPGSGTQAVPFAKLLLGQVTVVAQDPQPWELDGAVHQYAGAARVDKARIVQAGVAAEEKERLQGPISN